jgi:hypothetical protein
MPHSPADRPIQRRPWGGRVPAVVLAALAPAGAALAQPAPCAASSDSPRTAAAVIADVERQRCPAGSRLRAVMTIAGQAMVLQQSGICERDGFRTMSRTTADGSRGLGVTCTIAAR